MKKIKLFILSGTGVLLTLATAELYPNKTNSTTTIQNHKREPKAFAHTSNASVKLKSQPGEKLSDSAKDDQIFSGTEISDIGKVLNTINRYLDPNKAVTEFQNSSVDRYDLYLKAMDQIKKSYPTATDDLSNFIRQRVVATNIFQYSRHVSIDDCKDALKNIFDQYTASEKKYLLINLEFDFASTVKRCRQSFSEKYLVGLDKTRMPEKFRKSLFPENTEI